jgi:hypothetical protein
MKYNAENDYIRKVLFRFFLIYNSLDGTTNGDSNFKRTQLSYHNNKRAYYCSLPTASASSNTITFSTGTAGGEESADIFRIVDFPSLMRA